MARGSAQAGQAAVTAQSQANTAYGNANSLFGPLSSTLLSESAHPTGIDPGTMGKMDTAAMESAGGAGAGAMGAGALRAARTRNAGGSDAGIADAARTSGETATRGILANRVKSAEMQGANRRNALSGLGDLWSGSTKSGTDALNVIPDAVRARTAADRSEFNWTNELFRPLSAAVGKRVFGYIGGGGGGGGDDE